MPHLHSTAVSGAAGAARRLVVCAALIGGFTVFTVDGSSHIQASGEMTVGARLAAQGMLPAVRGRATTLTPPPPAPAPVSAPNTANSLDAFEREVITLTNIERVNVGLPPLAFSTELRTASRRHATDQRNRPCEVGYLTHTGTDGTSGADRILATGMPISRWGENVACAHPSPASVVRGWMKSPGHRANILNPLFTHIGAGTAASDTGQYYWVQNFATLR